MGQRIGGRGGRHKGTEAQREDEFIICARTDARSVEGLDAAIARAKEYVAAGADMSSVTDSGTSALQVAAYFNQRECAEYCVALNPELLTSTRGCGVTAAALAKRRGNDELAAWLVRSAPLRPCLAPQCSNRGSHFAGRGIA